MEGNNVAEKIIATCNDRVEELRDIAQKTVDNYWTMRLVGNDDPKIKRKSNMGCRIIPQSSQFSIEWYTNTYNRNSTTDIKAYSEHISKGRKSSRYSDMKLKKAATDWELEYVMEAENIFAIIREELGSLAKIRRALLTQKRVSAKLEQTLAPEDVFD